MADNNFFEDMNSTPPENFDNFYNQEPEKEGKKFPLLLLILGGTLGIIIAVLILKMLSSGEKQDNAVEIVAPIEEISQDVAPVIVEQANVYEEVKASSNNALNTAPLVETPKSVIAEKKAKLKEKEIKTLKPAKSFKSEGASEKAGNGIWQIQLSALGTDKAARDAWVKIQKDNSDILKNNSHEVQKKVVSGKTVYRLRITNMKSAIEADELCKLLKTRKTACFVTK